MSPITGVASGRLDRPIVIQTATPGTDPTTGQEVLTWNTTARVQAEWLPETATETWKARQIQASIEALYVMHDLSPRPTPERSRIIGHDGKTYDIKSVTEIQRGRGLMVAVAARAETPETPETV